MSAMKVVAIVMIAMLVWAVAIDQISRGMLTTSVAATFWKSARAKTDTLIVFAHGTQAGIANAIALKPVLVASGDVLAFRETGDDSDIEELVRFMVAEITAEQTVLPYKRIIFYGESKGGQLLVLVASALKADRLFDDVRFDLIMHGTPYDSSTLHGMGKSFGSLLGHIHTGKLMNLLPVLRWMSGPELDSYRYVTTDAEKRLIDQAREDGLSTPFSQWTAQVAFASRLSVNTRMLEIFKTVVYIIDTLDNEVVDGEAALAKFQQLYPGIRRYIQSDRHVNAARRPELNRQTLSNVLADMGA